MVPDSGIPDKVDAKAFLWLEKELHVVYGLLEAAERRVYYAAIVGFFAGLTFGLVIL